MEEWTVFSENRQAGSTLGKEFEQRVVCGVIGIRDGFFSWNFVFIFIKGLVFRAAASTQSLHSLETGEQEHYFIPLFVDANSDQ